MARFGPWLRFVVGFWLVTFLLPTTSAAHVELYAVQISLVRVAPDGKERVVCHQESFTTIVGKRTVHDSRGGLLVLEDHKELEVVRPGKYVLVSLLRKNGQLCLDVTVEIGETSPAPTDAHRVTMTGLRIVEPVTLGKTITVPLADGQGRWEVLVKEAEPGPGVPYVPADNKGSEK